MKKLNKIITKVLIGKQLQNILIQKEELFGTSIEDIHNRIHCVYSKKAFSKGK